RAGHARAARGIRNRLNRIEAAAMSEPTSSLRRSRSLRLTVRGWATLVAGVVVFVLAYTLGRRELLVVACLALLLSLGGLLITRLRRPKLDVIRLFSPPVVAAGSSAQVTLRVYNAGSVTRSEEHTSELQSRENLVCRLLLEK